jgi:isoquinoline 1-oxidoreductase beta subunit
MMGQLTAGLDDKGMPIALNIRLAGPSIAKRLMPAMLKGDLDPFVVEGLKEIAYDIPNQYLDYVMKDTSVPVGFWRSVANTHNAFFMESFMDELAHSSGKDPYHFRRDLLTHQPRYLKVLDTLAEQSHWDKPASPGHYRGLAIHQCFGSIAGEVADISLSATGEVTVHQVTCVIDCGIVVNPDTVKAQVEGSIVYGLSSLTEAISLKNGRVEQSNFHDYPVLRMVNMPRIDVHIIPSEDSPGGVGEPATPPIIPAITNAIFTATGKRIRHLPLKPEMLRK